MTVRPVHPLNFRRRSGFDVRRPNQRGNPILDRWGIASLFIIITQLLKFAREAWSTIFQAAIKVRQPVRHPIAWFYPP